MPTPDFLCTFVAMNVESGFLSRGGAPSVGPESASLSGLQTLYVSESGFFRILIGKHLGRKVVVKTLKKECRDNQVAIVQLRKEFSVQFPLSSPNVAHAFNMIRLEEGTPAIEMEWCDGRDVRELLEGSLAPEDVVEIIRGVLNGLKDIHQAGVIHRDIKPENVIYDPFRKVVKIIDFGCAYSTGSLTLQGPNGTDGYTPEAKTHVGSEAEPKDDLFALGVMVGEMAEAIDSHAKRVKKQLKRFAENLRAGEYGTSEAALEAFGKLSAGKRTRRVAQIAASAVILLALLIPLGRFLHTPREAEITPSAATTSDSPVVDAPAPPPDVAEQEHKAPQEETKTPKEPSEAASGTETGRPEPAKPASTSQPREYVNPYSAVSAEDEAAYELAIYAGKLLSAAKSKNAPLQTKMDAFVVNFCDSLYRAEKLYSKISFSIEEDDRRELAKTLSAQYGAQMEKEFRRTFGDEGTPHRRRVLLEGRFYGTLMLYHSAPKRKQADLKSSGKSN